jgi:hypothetical protein
VLDLRSLERPQARGRVRIVALRHPQHAGLLEQLRPPDLGEELLPQAERAVEKRV